MSRLSLLLRELRRVRSDARGGVVGAGEEDVRRVRALDLVPCVGGFLLVDLDAAVAFDDAALPDEAGRFAGCAGAA